MSYTTSYTSTLTSKYQVVIPKPVRDKVKMKAGQTMLIQALGDLIVLQPKKNQGWAQSLLGLGKDVWQNIDPVTYVRNERKSWKS